MISLATTKTAKAVIRNLSLAAEGQQYWAWRMWSKPR